ncbi:MAG: metal ABC transporter substrate-binding protein [Arachnia sp.]
MTDITQPHVGPRGLRLFIPAVLSAVALLLTSCSGADGSSSPPSTPPELDVVVSFYPLEFATTRIAGDLATVESLTAPGVDPHDIELSPQSVAQIKRADAVIYSAGLQAAVDQAVEVQAPNHSYDVNDAANLIAPEQQADQNPDVMDPHFWLDPVRMSDVSLAIADQLAEIDPENAGTYRGNAEKLATELSTLKESYDTALATCTEKDMITSHTAFRYIAEPYGFHQIGITGLAPESEPSAARLAEVSAIVKASSTTTVYSEVLLGARIAETVARETGAQVLVLDPIEGINESSAGTDYLEIMYANLDALREGQGCS